MEDLVSIIMPSYNTAQFIEESVLSVLMQTYGQWELIIVDDCSSDNTEDVIKTYLIDSRIHYMKNEKNSGAAVARNKALKEAKGKWIAFLDSDDLWEPEKLEKQIRFMKENNYHFSYTNYKEIDEKSKENGIWVTGPKKIGKIGMHNYCWPGCLTVMYDAEKIGLVQVSDIKKNNDYAMWLKICKLENCYLLDEVLAKYRRRKGSISGQDYRTLVGWHYKLFKIAENRSSLVAIIQTVRNIVFGILKKVKYVKKTV